MEYKFYQVDVFTRDPFGGNPLAVFPDAAGLSDSSMLQIAREMNLSETTFVFPAEWSGVDFEVRIFTPGKEIPFGGHPIIVYLREGSGYPFSEYLQDYKR